MLCVLWHKRERFGQLPISFEVHTEQHGAKREIGRGGTVERCGE